MNRPQDSRGDLKGATKCAICGRDLTAEMRHLGLTVCHRHKKVRR